MGTSTNTIDYRPLIAFTEDELVTILMSLTTQAAAVNHALTRVYSCECGQDHGHLIAQANARLRELSSLGIRILGNLSDKTRAELVGRRAS